MTRRSMVGDAAPRRAGPPVASPLWNRLACRPAGTPTPPAASSSATSTASGGPPMSSLHGQRFVDQSGTAGRQPGWAPVAPTPRPLSRGLAVASFVVGSCRSSIGMGAVRLRRWARPAPSRPSSSASSACGRHPPRAGHGRAGFAIAGIALSVAALRHVRRRVPPHPGGAARVRRVPRPRPAHRTDRPLRHATTVW